MRATPSHAEPQSDDGVKWKIYGPITNGEAYAVVVLLIGRVVVVTAHPPP